MRNDFYVGIYKDAYLAHFGIPNMKWYHRNGPPYPLDRQTHNRVVNQKPIKNFGQDILLSSKTSNLDKWGKSKDTNVLYITGLSGSGKSTLAQYLGKKNTDIIHLDMYFNQMSQETRNRYQNKSFNDYLNNTVPKWRQIPDMLAKDKSAKSEAWKTVDEFAKASEKFGQQQFGKRRKVIMEGVEILGETLYVDPSFYKNKPVIIAQTNTLKSSIRGGVRDGLNPIDIGVRAFSKDTKNWKRQMKQLESITNAKRYGG